jgi:thymidine phosphorylase
MIERQGGNPRLIDDDAVLPSATRTLTVRSAGSGVVQRIDAGAVGRASMMLGAGRERVDEPIDYAAGVVLAVAPGDEVAAGAPLMHLHHNGAARLDEAAARAAAAVVIGDGALAQAPLVLDWIHA